MKAKLVTDKKFISDMEDKLEVMKKDLEAQKALLKTEDKEVKIEKLTAVTEKAEETKDDTVTAA